MHPEISVSSTVFLAEASQMTEWICRTLRDGSVEGEHAPALSISDTISCPLASFVFDHILSQLSSSIVSNKSQSKGIVLVALSRSPLYYEQFLKRKGHDVASSNAWIKVLDCYSDPLGWKRKLVESGSILNQDPGSVIGTYLCGDIKDLEGLLSSIMEIGKELSGGGKGRFMVAIDSVSEMVRHSTVSSVATLLSNIRSHEQVSSLFWLLHSDLHEIRGTAALEYISSMLANIEPIIQLVDEQRGSSGNLYSNEENLRRGRLCVRVKRRNGRVRAMFEELSVEPSGIKFALVSSNGNLNAQTLVPKVQFNLQLTEKELNDRAKVVLPFEHQGNGKTIEIYDGRKSLKENQVDTQKTSVENVDSGKGEIIYFRDSDDEMPDSDEDPDDDLDI